MERIKNNLHIVKVESEFIGFDITSLNFFQLSEKSVDLIEGKELDAKEKASILNELDYYLAQGYFSDLGLPKSTKDFLTVYNFSIQNTLSCPLNCKYCFSKKIKAKEKEMSPQTAKAVVDFIFNYFEADADYYEIYFTSGGEPLCNFPLIKLINSLAQEKSAASGKPLRVGFTTNTLLLDEEKIEYLEENKIGIAISIDGEQKEHDLYRQLPSGEGTHDSIVKVLPRLLDSPCGYLNRPLAFTVLTPEQKDYISLVKYLVDLGFYKTNLKVIRNLNGEKPFIRREDLPAIKENYRKLIKFFEDEITNNRWRYVLAILDYNNMLGQLMLNILLKRKTLYRCDAGKSKFSITPDGDIYPCDYFSALPETKMGDIYSGILEEKREEWFKMTSLSLKECNLCWARYLCSGGCYYVRSINHGSADDIECELNKFLIEEVIKLLYELKKEKASNFRHLKYLAKSIAKISNYS